MIAELRQQLSEIWALSDRLFNLVPRSAWGERPIDLRHPLLFYVGHLPAFAWNQVARSVLGLGHLNKEFDELFAFGIDPVDEDGAPAAVEWPPVEAVLEYRDLAREQLLDLVEAVVDWPVDDLMARNGRIFQVVFEHECMHHETLQYMLQQLNPALKRRPTDMEGYRFERACDPRMVEVPGGEVVLGAELSAIEFGWDNEFPSHRVRVDGFSISNTLVTNGEWHDFVFDDGYRRALLWQPEDWAWRHRLGLEHPVTWRKTGDDYRLRTMFDELDLEQAAHWPVAVSLAEARAYCRWKGVRLPSEAELHRALYGAPGDEQRIHPWGDAVPNPGVHGNFGFANWSPTPVGDHPMGASAWGIEDPLGNLWQWTRSSFAGFPGFEAYMPGYRGYSADFFDDRHFVMLGASWATSPRFIRRSFRNWFQDRYPYVFAGFRTVERS
jgi:ergothioneine biosynthesis protein EgtB